MLLNIYEDIVSEYPTNKVNNQTVETTKETIKKAMAEMYAALNPPVTNYSAFLCYEVHLRGQHACTT
ncbi:MAG: hypothetical protein MGG11_22785 [Trichodesmium sp. MAG_R03]|nr:hypothetical protein [Trichodesmium sp. MAG_R03]